MPDDSMEPDINQDSILLINLRRDYYILNHKGIYLMNTPIGPVIRKVYIHKGIYFLTASNKDCRPESFTKTKVEIVGEIIAACHFIKTQNSNDNNKR